MLTKVTITGADDSVDINELEDLSLEFPFVEWAILVSWAQEGGYRFPSRKWIDEFVQMAGGERFNVSTHVCGRWVRDLLFGDLDWTELPSVIDICQRVQINTHGVPHVSTFKMVANLRQRVKEYIFQLDGVNDHLPYAATNFVHTSALYDTSAGVGKLPEGWSAPARAFQCGYAGGLSPDNVVEQIKKIQAVCRKNFWIDMERRVRTDDDSALDMKKVRKVLELSKPYIK